MTINNHVTLLVSVTTLNTDWSAQIDEVQDLNLTRIGLFLTMVDADERVFIYSKLEKVPNLRVPFVHLRADMTRDEIAYLRDRFGTRLFNTHSEKHYSRSHAWDDYHQEIYLENSGDALLAQELKQYAGLCIDFSHLEDDYRVRPGIYEATMGLVKQFPVGCGHISAISSDPTLSLRVEDGLGHYDNHHVAELDDLDYLKKYQHLFPPVLALELDNSIKEQIEFKRYITRMFVL